jgi:hypothetical protein
MEEPKTTALQTLTATHTTDIATNTANILTKQDLIITSTDLTCNKITTELGAIGTTNFINGFEFTRAFSHNIAMNSGFDSDGVKTPIISYNRSTGICVYSAKTQLVLKAGDVLHSLTASGFKIGENSTATEALDVAGNILASGSITAENLIVGSTNVITEITALQSLTATHTEDLATNTADILTKQPLITTSTDLETNSITTNNLNVNGNINLDTTTAYFDTIVIRRPTGLSGASNYYWIHFMEIQCWVNNINILASNSSILDSKFVLWSDKDTERPPNDSRPLSIGYNNNIIFHQTLNLAHSENNINSAGIIKNIPLTNINDIQSLVYYNVDNQVAFGAIGISIELYNSINDPDLTKVLANTNVITTTSILYRFDFPSISAYTEFATTGSTTNIVSNSIASTEDANIFSFSTELTGDLVSNINTTLADILSRLELLENA